MDLKDKVVIVTGGGGGIGEALCRRCYREGAAAIAVADIDLAAAERVSALVGGTAHRVNVGVEEEMAALVREIEERHGRVDVFMSNAGILMVEPDHVASNSNEDWQRIWEINVMSHIYAARAALPGMLTRGSGYFVITASAAGLLNLVGCTAYSVTKHAAISFAESLTIAHGDQGIGVSALCPQAVNTEMVASQGGPGAAGLDGTLEPDEVAEHVVTAMAEGRFLILPHPQVAEYIKFKANDYDKWLGNMRHLHGKFCGQE